MRKMVVCGIVCCAAGVLLWGVIGPTMIPGMDGSTVHWGKVAQRVAYVSVGAGIVIGIGLALMVIGVLRRNN
jgi:hypothetical protein